MMSPRQIVTQRSVLVFKEKHGSVYYVVDNDDELFAVALAVVSGRLAMGYYYYDPGPAPTIDLTKEKIAFLPESLQDDARRRLKEHKQRLDFWRNESAIWDVLNKAVKEGDGRRAWEALQDRRDWEYEGYSLEPVQDDYAGVEIKHKVVA